MNKKFEVQGFFSNRTRKFEWISLICFGIFITYDRKIQMGNNLKRVLNCLGSLTSNFKYFLDIQIPPFTNKQNPIESEKISTAYICKVTSTERRNLHTSILDSPIVSSPRNARDLNKYSLKKFCLHFLMSSSWDVSIKMKRIRKVENIYKNLISRLFFIMWIWKFYVRECAKKKFQIINITSSRSFFIEKFSHLALFN